MEQCKYCVLRGQIEVCEKTPCTIHEAWYVELLKTRLAEAQAQLDGLNVALGRANTKLSSVRDELYGHGFEVLGWHLNGATESLDSWFESNDWEPEACEALAKLEEPKEVHNSAGVVVYLNGKDKPAFKCSCGCNVFHHPDMGTKEETLRTYDCNACDTRYIGE